MKILALFPAFCIQESERCETGEATNQPFNLLSLAAQNNLPYILQLVKAGGGGDKPWKEAHIIHDRIQLIALIVLH